jgi:hypothetical protein
LYIILIFNGEADKSDIINCNVDGNIFSACFNVNISDLNFKSIFDFNTKIIDVIIKT